MISVLKPRRRAASVLFALIACTSLPALSYAAQASSPAAEPAYVLHTDVRAQGVDLDNGDLGTDGNTNDANASLEIRPQFTWNFNPHALFYGEARAVGSVGHGGNETGDTGGISNGRNFLELRQAYVEFNDLGGDPLSFRAGRQKIREPYGDWWNENFDALRLTYTTTSFAGDVGLGQNLAVYRTDGNGFSTDDRDATRVMAEGSWQYHFENFIEARALYQDDRRGADVGQKFSESRLDLGENSLLWAGLRAAGKTHFMGNDKLSYRVDLMGVGGHEDLPDTAPSGTTDRIVTAVNGRDVRAWAFDAATDIPIPNATPLIHLGYAYGSGDGDTADGTDHMFRQDGLAGNFSQFGALTEATNNYGTVLRPDLSNIHILSAGVTMPVMQASNLGAVYRYYRLSEPTTALVASGVDNTLNGVDKGLGQGLDFLFNADILKEANLTPHNGVSDVTFRSSLGFFWAGDAYGAADGDMAARGLVEVNVSF
jgi:alginate production protein